MLKCCFATLRKFDELMDKTDGDPDRKTLARFVEDNFTLENQLEEFEPRDWIDEPSILDVISGRWHVLCRVNNHVDSHKYKLYLN